VDSGPGAGKKGGRLVLGRRGELETVNWDIPCSVINWETLTTGDRYGRKMKFGEVNKR